jgi:hypothetical protein
MAAITCNAKISSIKISSSIDAIDLSAGLVSTYQRSMPASHHLPSSPVSADIYMSQ